MRIYVASSWRNLHQPDVVRALSNDGHEVYDFKNPEPGNNGFRWSEIDPAWESWTPQQYRKALSHPVAVDGFNRDMAAMRWANACVLVLPAGRSASWELGWFAGQGKECAVFMLEKLEPELMYGGGGQAAILTDYIELIAWTHRRPTCPFKGCSDRFHKRPPCALCYE